MAALPIYNFASAGGSHPCSEPTFADAFDFADAMVFHLFLLVRHYKS